MVAEVITWWLLRKGDTLLLDVAFHLQTSTSRARGNNSAEGCFCAIQTAMSSRRTSRAILIWPPLPLQRDRPVDTLPGFSQKRFKFTKLLVMVLA